jgi:hypothetical protein
MRHLGAAGLIAIVTASGCAPPEASDSEVVSSAATSGGAALLVVGNASLAPGDAALKQRLLGLQLAVSVKTGPLVQASDAAGKVVVVISDSVTSADVNTRLRDVGTPVLCLETALFDDMRFTGPTFGTDYGTLGSQSEVALVASHPLAQGLTLPATTAKATYGWGRPVAGATIIATIAGAADRAALFAFEAGQPLFGGAPAPARRVGAFMTSATPALFTAQSWKLFDNAIHWLLPPQACASDADCGANRTCVNARCTTACPAGSRTCGGSVCLPPGSCCPGEKTCGGQCLPLGACCTDGECSAPPNMVSRCQNNQCSAPICNPGTKMCSGQCLPLTACCSDGECTAPPNMVSHCQATMCLAPVCLPGFKACSSTSCVPATACCPGQRLCNGQCIGGNLCCVTSDCPINLVCEPTSHQCLPPPP